MQGPPRTRSPSRRPRGPGVVYLALAVTLVLLVGVVAFATAQPPPPTIAEFAPRSLEQITDAPEEQEAHLARGGQPTPTPTVPPTGSSKDEDADGFEHIVTERVRRCVGEPPRQIEDRQSPPCVPYWEGDNGGSNGQQGVTGDTITIAWPQIIERGKDIATLEAFFNSRFEFYGRKIRLEPYIPLNNSTGESDPADMVADAITVDEEIKAFASLAYFPFDGAERIHYEELAKRQILSVDSRQTLREVADYERHSPYEWTIEAPYDVMLRNFGEWYCASLARFPAAHAGADVSKAEPRKLGLIVARDESGITPDPSVLKSTLERCGVTPAYEGELGPEADFVHEGETEALNMRSQGVTSVVCICPAGQLGKKLMQGATSQGYHPEWLFTPFIFQDRETAGVEWPQDQARHAFGLAFRNKWLNPFEMPWYSAMREIDPEWDPRGAHTSNAASSGQQGYNNAIVERYGELLLLASGIQMAGPRLTPETFAEGLRQAEFPNPGCGGAPYYQACIRYGPRDHSAHDDATVIWWNPSGENWTTNKPYGGAYCYAERGERHGLGTWPQRETTAFTGSCR